MFSGKKLSKKVTCSYYTRPSTDYVEYWIEMSEIAYKQLEQSKLDEKTKEHLIYTASHLYEEIKKAANQTST